METINLAIVDDHRLFRQGLRQILERFPGLQVVLEAASAEDLLAQLAIHRPDVVLMDLHLPGLDGQQASRQLLTSHPNLKILVVSMEYSPEFILDLLREGVHGYLPKDIEPEILVQAIWQVYEKGYYLDDTLAKVMREGLQTKKNVGIQVRKPVINQMPLDLTEREKEVLALLCKGYNSLKIAEKLFISFRTVEGHRKHLLEKTGAINAVSLAVFAIKHQLLDS